MGKLRTDFFAVCVACMELFAFALCYGEEAVVLFDEIQGAKRFDAKRGVWSLAIGGPQPLFADGSDMRVVDCQVSVEPRKNFSLCRVEGLSAGVSFLCALDIADAQGGIIDLVLQGAQGEVLCSGAVSFGRKGRVSCPLFVEEYLSHVADGEITFSLRASGSVKICRMILCRTFRQAFYVDSPYRLSGVGLREFSEDSWLSGFLLPGDYRHHVTQKWNAPPTVSMDGVEVACLDKNYRCLMSTYLGEEAGIRVPLSVKMGAWISWRGYGTFRLALKRDVWAKNEKAILLPNGGGRGWNSFSESLDMKALDNDQNGIWGGRRLYKWQHAKTMIQNYGKGGIGYIAVFPQNVFPLYPAGPGELIMRYLGKDNEEKEFSASTGNVIDAVGLLHAGGYKSNVMFRCGGEWQKVGEIMDQGSVNMLEVIPGSVMWHVN